MRSFAVVALLAGAVAAVPQYGGEPANNGGYGSPAPPSSSEAPVVVTSVAYHTVQSCYGGCPDSTPAAEATSTPCPTATPVYGSSSEVPVPSSTPVYGSSSEVPVPSSTPVYGAPSSSSAAAEGSSTPCPTGSTVTVTVSQAPYPTGASSAPAYPTGSAAPTMSYSASPSSYTGAASNTNAGLALAGVGAIAALFL